MELFIGNKMDVMRRQESKFITTSLVAILSLIGGVSFPLPAKGSVRVWEEAKAIPTYRVEKPDVNPIFYGGRAYQGAKGPVYPYPLQDRLTDVRETRIYRALYLENDYLRICVLPEIGGRIFEALDKTNGYHFFYAQHVIKPALIGMLGAWISGGVEWNFPHHHRATSFMSVDSTVTEKADGSKTIWVGEVELRHRMKWLVGLTLYPDRSYLEATVKIMNRTPFAHSFLWWANVAVHASFDYQILFPPTTEYATYHGKNQFSRWPISYEVFNGVDYTRGVDVSWYRNHPAPTSFFAWNSEEDFLAGYDHKKEAGVVHVADHRQVPGKKFWTWGTGEQGKLWEKILTDEDGPYIELMVGAFSDNQPDYSWLQPYEVRTFKQYWYPLRKIGGVKAANLKAASNLEISRSGKVSIGFNTTREHRGARAVLLAQEKAIFDERIDISPQNPFRQETGLPQGVREEDLRLVLFSPEGEILLSYSPPLRRGMPMPEPVKPPAPPQEIKTTEELYLAGLRLEQFHSPALEPYPYYEEALRRDPEDAQANTALGILYLKRGMAEKAENHLERALARLTRNYTSPKNGEPCYYLGLALRAQGKEGAAFDAFSKAAWSDAWRAASYYSLAELCSSRGDYGPALDFLDRSLAKNSQNTKALNLKASLLRRMGRFEEAEKIASRVLDFDPLDFWAGNEVYLLKWKTGEKGQALEVRKNLDRKMRDSSPSYLELATDYGNCGLVDEAVEVLLRLVEKKNQESSFYPMLYYYLGYFMEKKGDSGQALKFYKLASRMPTDYCFPFRLESIAVLRSAQGLNPGDARAAYYLGNLLFDIQPEKAIQEWEKSRQLDGSFSTVHRNLGLAYARVENDLAKATTSLEKAVACHSQDPRLYYELDLLYEAAAVSPQKRLAILQKNHHVVVERDDALSREIALLVQLGKYDRAIDLLSRHHFHVWEGGGEIHDLYVDAHLWRGEDYLLSGKARQALEHFLAALEYPENLEVAKPYRGGREPQIDYFIGAAYEALGDMEKAMEYYHHCVEKLDEGSEVGYYQGLALRKIGRHEEAEKMFESLIQTGKERLGQAPAMDFFAKFGERQSAIVRQADAHYLLGLGYLGMGKNEEGKAELKKALELNINHAAARRRLER